MSSPLSSFSIPVFTFLPILIFSSFSPHLHVIVCHRLAAQKLLPHLADVDGVSGDFANDEDADNNGMTMAWIVDGNDEIVRMMTIFALFLLFFHPYHNPTQKTKQRPGSSGLECIA